MLPIVGERVRSRPTATTRSARSIHGHMDDADSQLAADQHSLPPISWRSRYAMFANVATRHNSLSPSHGSTTRSRREIPGSSSPRINPSRRNHARADRRDGRQLLQVETPRVIMNLPVRTQPPPPTPPPPGGPCATLRRRSPLTIKKQLSPRVGTAAPARSSYSGGSQSPCKRAVGRRALRTAIPSRTDTRLRPSEASIEDSSARARSRGRSC